MKVIYRDDVLKMVMKPDTKLSFWKDSGTYRAEEIQLNEVTEIAPDLVNRLQRAGVTDQVATFAVPEGFVGLMFVNRALDRQLPPGQHCFWNTNTNITVTYIDLRQTAHEVNGQEILTKDRVSLRVNISAEFRVTDPEKATLMVQDYSDTLHRSLQFAFRKTLGALTLDELLSEKVSVDASAAEAVREEMAKIGLEVGEIALKDVILPGEMREILNQVVTAQKQAEANVIRRREETNATRSLLNTAKVMAENPVMLRLKELEAIESISSKVDQLTILNGTEGLMSDLVKLSAIKQ